MATDALGRNTLVLTFIANGSIAANHFILPEATDGTSAIGTSGAAVGGVCRDSVSDGQVGDKIIDGTAFVLTSANIATGNPVACDTGGTARVATTADVTVGRALKSTNSGEYAEIHLGNEGIF
jgi:hypothetical protein